MGCCFSDDNNPTQRNLAMPLINEDGSRQRRDIYEYREGADNAQVYRKHEILRDHNDQFLTKQKHKDVHQLLAKDRRPKMAKDVRQDIQIRGGVLPAPTEDRQYQIDQVHTQFDGTEGQRRATVDRQNLEPAYAQKRKQSQLMKMQRNMQYQTNAGKRAIEIALEDQPNDTDYSVI